MELNRRSAITGLAAGTAALAVPLEARSAPALDLTSPAGRFRTFALMRAALDERLCTNWVSAQYYAVVEDRMEPLFGVVSAVFSRYRRRAAGGLEAVSAEVAWFTDPVTGKALDEFHNPWIDRKVKVPEGGLMPAKVFYGEDLSLKLARSVPGLDMAHEVLPIEARGDDVWLIERMRTAMTPPGKPRPFRYSESNIFRTSRRALAAKGATRVTSDVSFTNVCSWRPWLEMGDHPGHMTAAGIGRQNATTDSLPPAWVEATRARRPGLLEDPAAILQPLWDQRA